MSSEPTTQIETVDVADPTTHRHTRPDAIPALTGLRIIGAAWVVLYHMQPTLYEAWSGLRAFEPILAIGDYGVPLFFILSGFIIWHNYGRRDLLAPRATVRFVWRRFARLWPVNVAMAAASIPLIWWAVNSQGYWGAPVPWWYSVRGWLASAFMVTSIGSAEPVFAWNQPSWTLTGEMLAYIVFPLLLILALVGRVGRARHRWPWLIAAFALAYFAKSAYASYPFRWIVDLLVIFLVGVLIRVAGRPMRFPWLTSTLQIAVPVGIVLAAYLGRGDLITLLLAIWVWALAAPTGPAVWLFSSKPFQIAGLSSYSVYMSHWVVFGYGSLLLFYVPWIKEHALPIYVVLILCVVAAFSWAMWRFFESPARELLNRIFERLWPQRRRAEEPVASTPAASPLAFGPDAVAHD